MSAPLRYYHDIPSLQSVNPTLPATIGHMDLNRSISKGDVIDRENLGAIHMITNEVVETAEPRVKAMEVAHTPFDAMGTLVDINNNLKLLVELSANLDESVKKWIEFQRKSQ